MKVLKVGNIFHFDQTTTSTMISKKDAEKKNLLNTSSIQTWIEYKKIIFNSVLEFIEQKCWIQISNKG